MHYRHAFGWSAGLVLAWCWLFVGAAAWGQQDVEVLPRGPIHEAFAETITHDPQPGIVVDREPPAPVKELPPDVRPTGERVRWIPGYWFWDEDRQDFVWVSGVWRHAPPGRRWVPGYWSPLENGYQWISGFWAPEVAEEIEYLPEPPASLEQGANQPAPSQDHYWVPGCWVWRGGYVWRPGAWVRIVPGWTWVPSHYHYSPRGVVFVDGYWDYPLADRGYLFAPVYFAQPVYRQGGFVYRPRSLIDLALLTASLFIHPGHHHYYYGPYFGPDYFARGFYPWYGYGSHYRGYDPFFSYYRWHHHRQRKEANWQHDLIKEYERRGKEAPRPRIAPDRDKEAKPADRALTRSLADFVPESASRHKPESLDDVAKRIEQMQRLRDERRASEHAQHLQTPPDKAPQATRSKLDKRDDQAAKQDRPGGSQEAVGRWRIPEVEAGKAKPAGEPKAKVAAPPPPKKEFVKPPSKSGKPQGGKPAKPAKPPKSQGGSGKGKKPNK